MRQRVKTTYVLVLGSLCAPFAAAHDSLDRVRTNVREGNPSDTSSDPPASAPAAPASSKPESSYFGSKKYDDCNHCDDSNSDWSFLGTLIGVGITSPYWVPISLVDPGWATPYEFPTFPYREGPGYLEQECREHTEWWQLRKSRQWGGRFAAEYGDSFDDQHWIGGRALLEGPLRMGLDLDLRHWEQSNDPGLGDSLWLGKSDVLFRFAQNENWQFRSGLGVNWLSDPVESNFGFNFTYGVDWYPMEPLIFSSEIDLGTLGQAFLFHFRTSAGVIWGPTELYVAYDYFDIGDAQLRGVATGLRVWF